MVVTVETLSVSFIDKSKMVQFLKSVHVVKYELTRNARDEFFCINSVAYAKL